MSSAGGRTTDGPLVSVVVPAYNAEPFIAETLESALAQTHRTLEVIVVDDGSTDGTAKIVRFYAARDSRVRLLQQPNAGVARARNLGILNSTGELVAPLDADDVWYPDKLAKQIACLRDGGERVGLVYCGSLHIDVGGIPTGHWCLYDIEGQVLLPLVYRNFIGNASTPVIRRRCLEVAGLYDPNWRAQAAQGLEDWDLYVRLAERFEFRAVPEVLASYRQHPHNMTADMIQMARAHGLLMQAIRQRHPEIPERIFRWSASDLYLYFALLSAGDRRDWNATRHWLLRAVEQDAYLLVQPRLYRPMLKTLRLVLRSLITGKPVHVASPPKRPRCPSEIAERAARGRWPLLDPFFRRLAARDLR